MKKLLFSLSAAMLLFSACQKETSLEQPNTDPGGGGGGGNPSLGLLRRLVLVAGADSSAADYTYDASNRLATFTSVSTDGSYTSQRIVRNSAGLMTQFVTKNDTWLAAGFDSVVSTVIYDNTFNRYKYSTFSLSMGTSTYTDSTALNYDGNGNLTEKISFGKLGTALFEPYQKVEYTYGAGNVLSEKYYEPTSTGGWQLLVTYGYSYDVKANPIKLGPEAMIVLDDGSYFSNNNVVSLNISDPADPNSNFSINTAYTYNSADKPASGAATQSPGSGTYLLRYYYN